MKIINIDREAMFRDRRAGMKLIDLCVKYKVSRTTIIKMCTERGVKPLQPIPRGVKAGTKRPESWKRPGGLRTRAIPDRVSPLMRSFIYAPRPQGIPS